MNRQYYLDIAATGAAFPIGTDLIVHESKHPEEVLLNGELLGKAVQESAVRYKTPMAYPLMDLSLEKLLLLQILGVPLEKKDTFHFESSPSDEILEKVRKELPLNTLPRIKATCDAIRYISTKTDLLPMGMCIGTFSLATKLIADPITPVFLAGMGVPPEEDDGVAMVKKVLEIACLVVEQYISLQLDAGAKAVIMCEPAANKIYISPHQIESGSDVFERCVMDYGFRIKRLLDSRGADLVFHDCGELTDDMLKNFVSFDPAIMSLGSSRKLWEDARLIPKNIVLYGNLPSKHFYSDERITKNQVAEMSEELILKMKNAGHPFILGTECDVLYVPESDKAIRAKVDAFVNFSRR